jgi:hypothetical protein
MSRPNALATLLDRVEEARAAIPRVAAIARDAVVVAEQAQTMLSKLADLAEKASPPKIVFVRNPKTGAYEPEGRR